MLLAVVEHLHGGFVGEVVTVLNGRDLDDVASGLDLLHGHLRDTDVPNLALILKLFEDAELFLARDLGIDAMQLPKINGLQLEAPQTHLTLLTQVLGPADRRPRGRTLSMSGMIRVRPALVAIVTCS